MARRVPWPIRPRRPRPQPPRSAETRAVVVAAPQAIPHLEMWKDLPYLVRDGVVFSIDTIKSKARSQYQTVL